MKKNQKLEDAVDTLRHELKTDKELYYVYQSNIAMAFYDEAARKNLNFTNADEGFQKLHEAANEGAKRFLDLLISEDGK
jgi:hypothetical protein